MVHIHSNETRNLSDLSVYFYMMAEIMVSILAITINASVLCAILYFKSLKKSATSYFIAALALSDFFVGCSVPFLVVATLLRFPQHFYWCVFLNCLFHTFTNISAYSMLMVAVERYIAVTRPFFYLHFVSSYNVITIVTFFWSMAIFLSFVPLIFASTEQTENFKDCEYMHMVDIDYMFYITFFGVTLVSFFMVAWLHIGVMHVAQRTRTAIGYMNNLSKKEKNRLRTDMQELQNYKTLFFTIIAIPLLCMPLHVANILMIFDVDFPRTEVLPMVVVLNHFNSCVNPVLYSLCYKKYRTAVRWVFCKKHVPMTSSISEITYTHSEQQVDVDNEIRKMEIISTWSTLNSHSSTDINKKALAHEWLNKLPRSIDRSSIRNSLADAFSISNNTPRGSVSAVSNNKRSSSKIVRSVMPAPVFPEIPSASFPACKTVSESKSASGYIRQTNEQAEATVDTPSTTLGSTISSSFINISTSQRERFSVDSSGARVSSPSQTSSRLYSRNAKLSRKQSVTFAKSPIENVCINDPIALQLAVQEKEET